MNSNAGRIKRFRVKTDKFVFRNIGTMGHYPRKAISSQTAPGQILWAIEQARKSTSCKDNLRILEVGGGSGRLAKTLINSGQVKPENYFLMDEAYGSKEPYNFITVNKKLVRLANKGKFNIISQDVHQKPVSGLKGNQVNLILASGVSGAPSFLHSLLKNYFDLLSPGGYLVVDRAETSWSAMRWLEGRGTQDYHKYLPFNQNRPKSRDVPFPVHQEQSKLLQEEISSLIRNGKITGIKDMDDLFVRNGTWCPNVFVLQKAKN
jgi:hypothetical protein